MSFSGRLIGLTRKSLLKCRPRNKFCNWARIHSACVLFSNYEKEGERLKENIGQNIPKEAGAQDSTRWEPLEELEKRLEEISWDIDALFEKTKQDAEMTAVEQYFAGREEHPHETEEGNVVASSNIAREYKFLFGTPDPYKDILKDVLCGGCGSILHCTDPGMPGYMSSELYKTLTREELQKSKCTRCNLMEQYDIMLEVKASDSEFSTILSKIKFEKSLILVIVDLTDIENSLIKNLFEHIGKRRPLYIIGNKVDLIPNDGRGYLTRIRKTLMKACEENGLNPSGQNIKHVALLSGKTGYGVEDLVTKLLVDWKFLGNIGLIFIYTVKYNVIL